MKRFVALLALGGLVTACTPNAATPTASTNAPTATANTVTIQNNRFSPAALSIKAGDSVTFINQDAIPHTATANDSTFDTGTLAPGESKTIKLEKAGAVGYICKLHPSMAGSVAIQ